MQSNLVSSWLSSLNSNYPNPTLWHDHVPFQRRDVYRFARLWLLEGIPFAFNSTPAAYEIGREAFAEKLGEHPRQVSMVGSGRLGFSLATHKFGTPYENGKSDLDLFLVSLQWFNKLSEDANCFVARFNAGLAKPRSEFERKIWTENTSRLPSNMDKGFVNQHYIPCFDRYANTKQVYGACETFLKTVNKCIGSPALAKVSVRVYRSWEDAESQIGGSLIFALKQLGHKVE